MKKILLILILTFVSVLPVSADLWAVRGYLEVMGQENLVFNTREIMAVPAEGDRSYIWISPSLVFNGVFMFGGDDGLFAAYIKKDHIDIRNNCTVLYSEAADSYISNDEQWGLHYIGVGGRKYFFTENWGVFSFMPYAGLDLGAFFASNTVSKITVRNGSGSVLASGEMEGSGGFFGVNAEVGTDFWFMNEFALTAKLGYRFCGGTIKSTKSSETIAFAPTLADVYDMQTNYSGFYFQLGLALNFQRYD